LTLGDTLKTFGYEWLIDNWDTKLLEIRRNCLEHFESLVQNNLVSFIFKTDFESPFQYESLKI